MSAEFPSEWRVLPLEDCMDSIIDYRGKTPSKATFGIPLITAKIVKNGRILEPDEFIDPGDYETWMRRGLPQAGDVVVTTEAPLGEVAQLHSPRVALAQRLIVLRGKPGLLENTFLKFLMQSSFVQEQLKARATGTTVLGIKQSELRRVSLAVPPLVEQQAIARILGTLHDKNELHRRMSQTLEDMACTLFKSWFVDFDPVRAKAEGRDPAGMDAATAALFPDSFEDAALGPIPNGWRVVPLHSLTSYLSRGIGPAYIDRGGICVFNQKCIRGRRIDPSKARRHDPTQKSIEGRELRVLDVLVNSTGVGTLGRVAQVWSLPEPAIVDSHVTVVRASEQVDPSTGQTELSRSRLAALEIVEPPLALQTEYGRLIKPAFMHIAANERESANLAALRDTLLPRLLSGELRVSNPDTFLQEQGR